MSFGLSPHSSRIACRVCFCSPIRDSKQGFVLRDRNTRGWLIKVPYSTTLLYLLYVTIIARSRQLFARRRHQKQAALQFYQLYTLSRSPFPNPSPEEIYEAVDDLIQAVAYEFNLQLAARPAIFRQFPLVRVQEDYQGHVVDVIYTNDPRPMRLPCRSSQPQKPSKPCAAL